MNRRHGLAGFTTAELDTIYRAFDTYREETGSVLAVDETLARMIPGEYWAGLLEKLGLDEFAERARNRTDRHYPRFLRKYLKYRATIAHPAARPIGFLEWSLGRVQGKLAVITATQSQRRRDYPSLNHALLSTWAGNQSYGGHAFGGMAPSELSKALREDRVRIVIDPATDQAEEKNTDANSL